MRPLSLLAALAFLAAPPVRAEDGGALGRIKTAAGKMQAAAGKPVVAPALGDMSIDESCTEKYRGILAQAVPAAMEKGSSCLATLNPQIWKRIEYYVKKGGIRFVCECVAKTEGGRTEQRVEKNGELAGADITINFCAIGAGGYQGRVLHELVHAVDNPKKEQFIDSPASHKSSADQVWGCHYGCFPDVVGDDQRKMIQTYENGRGEIKQDTRVSCAGDSYCWVAQKFGGLCSGEYKRKNSGGSGTCIVEHLLNFCEDKACQQLVKEVTDSIAATDGIAQAMGMKPTGTMPGPMKARLNALAQAIVQARDSGGADSMPAGDKKYFLAAKKHNFFDKTCSK